MTEKGGREPPAAMGTGEICADDPVVVERLPETVEACCRKSKLCMASEYGIACELVVDCNVESLPGGEGFPAARAGSLVWACFVGGGVETEVGPCGDGLGWRRGFSGNRDRERRWRGFDLVRAGE